MYIKNYFFGQRPEDHDGILKKIYLENSVILAYTESCHLCKLSRLNLQPRSKLTFIFIPRLSSKAAETYRP